MPIERIFATCGVTFLRSLMQKRMRLNRKWKQHEISTLHYTSEIIF